MAKPTHPTPQSLKTGQTVYTVYADMNGELKMRKQKVIRVPQGYVPTSAKNCFIFNQQVLEDIMERCPQLRSNFFYSRGKAERAVEMGGRERERVYQSDEYLRVSE